MTIAVRIKRLRNGIRELLRRHLWIGDERRLRPRHTRSGENQDVRPVREQAETDDQLRQPTPQHQIQPGGIEHARDDGE